MTKVIFALRLRLILLLLAPVLGSHAAQATVAPARVASQSMQQATTTVIAARAQSDLQIRRLKTLFAAKQLDAEVYFDKIRLLRSQSKESSSK